jgi:hypothetical protein
MISHREMILGKADDDQVVSDPFGGDGWIGPWLFEFRSQCSTGLTRSTYSARTRRLSVPDIQVELAATSATRSVRSMRGIVIEPQTTLDVCDGIIVPAWRSSGR